MSLAKKSSKSGGFTLIEMVIVLGIIAVLAGVLVPTLTKYIRDSKLKRAQKDVQLLCAAIGQFNNDTGKMPVSSDWGGGTKNDVETLQGPGTAPTDKTGSATGGWFTDTGEPSGGLGVTDRVTDALNDQIGNNTANYPVGTGPTGQGWRGPYLSKIDEDPWGNMYLVNVKNLQPSLLHANQKSVLALSAGPDGAIDTPFEGATDVVEAADDDIVCRLK